MWQARRVAIRVLLALAGTPPLACGPKTENPEPSPEAKRLCTDRCARDLDCDPASFPPGSACVDQCMSNEDWHTKCADDLTEATQCTSELSSCEEYAAMGSGPGSPCHEQIDAYSNCITAQGVSK